MTEHTFFFRGEQTLAKIIFVFGSKNKQAFKSIGNMVSGDQLNSTGCR